MTDPLKIGGEFTIARDPGAIEPGPRTLAEHLIRLSEETKRCYDLAIEQGRSDVAQQLVLMANAADAAIAVAPRGSLEKVQ